MLLVRISLMRLKIGSIPFIVVSVLVAPIVEGFVIHPIYAQTNISTGNMTDAMVSLARFHLRAADTALANGNSTEALHQLTLSQLQVLMLGMKTMGTVGVTSDTSSVPDNCIILKGGVLECRDSLTQSISFSNQSRS